MNIFISISLTSSPIPLRIHERTAEIPTCKNPALLLLLRRLSAIGPPAWCYLELYRSSLYCRSFWIRSSFFSPCLSRYSRSSHFVIVFSSFCSSVVFLSIPSPAHRYKVYLYTVCLYTVYLYIYSISIAL